MTDIIRSTNGLSGDDVETQLLFFQTHAPACLAEFQPRRVDLRDHHFDGHGEELNSYWSIACRCGSDKFKVHGYPIELLEIKRVNGRKIRGELVPSGSWFLQNPLELECTACGHTALLLDTDAHGYNAVACGDSETNALSDELARKTVHQCGGKDCNGIVFSVIARFEYPGDLFDDDDLRGREVDLFSWFTLVGDCNDCGRRADITEFECA